MDAAADTPMPLAAAAALPPGEPEPDPDPEQIKRDGQVEDVNVDDAAAAAEDEMLVKELGAIRLTDAAGEDPAHQPQRVGEGEPVAADVYIEPVFGREPVDLDAPDEVLLLRLVLRFGASEYWALMSGDGFQRYRTTGAGAQCRSDVQALVVYLQQRMWFEQRLPVERHVLSAATKEPLTVIGLSATGCAAVFVRTTGQVMWGDLNETDCDSTRLSWQPYDGYLAPTIEVPVYAEGVDPAEPGDAVPLRHETCVSHPTCGNIEGSTVCLWYDGPGELHIIADVQSGTTGEYTVMRPTFAPDTNLQGAIATRYYATLIDTKGRVAFVDMRTPELAAATPFFPVYEPSILTRPAVVASADANANADASEPPAAAAAAAEFVNPVSGAPLDADAENPPAPDIAHHIYYAFCNELNAGSVVLSSLEGNEFTVYLPEPGEPKSEPAPVVATDLTLIYHDMSLEHRRGPDAVPFAAPSRAPAIGVCFREMADDFTMAKCTKHGLHWMTTRSANAPAGYKSLRLPLYEHNDTVPWNSVAVLGSVLVAHAQNGRVYAYSLLNDRKNKRTMQLTTDAPEMLVECPPCGYRSLYVTPNKVFCLQANGSVLVCY
jgi:hypothetical protein